MATKKKNSTAGAKRRTGTKTKSKARLKSKTKANSRNGGKPGRAAPAAQRRRAAAILRGLEQEHPDAHCELNFSSGLELLIGTILAAQCTDARVNIVTESLFRKYRTAKDYVDTPAEVLEDEIRSTGFFRNKTKSIKKACQSLIDLYGGDVPSTMHELLDLAGVGRKTANCILANVFQIPGIVVDTHMLRISRRMGFTEETDPVKVEFALMELFDDGDWISLSHRIPWHGRRVCSARKPQCDTCGVAADCPKLL